MIAIKPVAYEFQPFLNAGYNQSLTKLHVLKLLSLKYIPDLRTDCLIFVESTWKRKLERIKTVEGIFFT